MPRGLIKLHSLDVNKPIRSRKQKYGVAAKATGNQTVLLRTLSGFQIRRNPGLQIVARRKVAMMPQQSLLKPQQADSLVVLPRERFIRHEIAGKQPAVVKQPECATSNNVNSTVALQQERDSAGGTLHWIERVRSPAGVRIKRVGDIHFYTTMSEGEDNITADMFNRKMLFQLMPIHYLFHTEVYKHLSSGTRVLFHMQNNDMLKSLSHIMRHGFVGFVSINAITPQSTNGFTVFIICYKPDDKPDNQPFFGIIPKDQAGFKRYMKLVFTQSAAEHAECGRQLFNTEIPTLTRKAKQQ